MDTIKEKRLLWLDCLKVFSAFLIVLNHSISQEWIRLVWEDRSVWFILNAVFMLSRAGLPVFFLCSGVGMLQKKRTLKSICFGNVFTLLRTYCCWMLIFGICDVFSLWQTNMLSLRTGVNAMIKAVIFGKYHTWFIATILGIYIIIPFLQEITEKRELLRYFLVLSTIFTILLPYMSTVPALARLYKVVEDINMKFVVGYTLYFMLGYYLSQIRTDRLKWIAPAVLLLCLISGGAISYHVSVSVGTDCQKIYNEFSFFGFLISIFLFLSFRVLFCEGGERFRKLMAKTAGLGIGIYLAHPLFQFLIRDFEGLYSILGAVILYLLVFGIMLILSVTPMSIYFLGIHRATKKL